MPRAASPDRTRLHSGQYTSASAAGRPAPTSAVRSRRRLLLIGAGALAIVLAAGTVALAMNRDTDRDGADGGPPATEPATDAPATENSTQDPTEDPVPLDEQCTEDIMSNPIWVCLTSATLSDGQLILAYDVEWNGNVPETNGGYHLHIYGGDGTSPPDHIMGSHAGNEAGSWKIRDENPAILNAEDIAAVIGDYPKVCARIASGDHALVPDLHGGYATGNCLPIEQ